MSIEIRIVGSDESHLLGSVAQDLFDNPVEPDLVAAFFRQPNHHLCVALDGGVIVGFASGVVYVHPDKPPQLWINEVGVAPTHRRKGVGKALVGHLVSLGQELGCTEIWVATEGDNEPARALYRSAGGIETPDIVMATFPPPLTRT